ncbi:MAG: SAM-dependent methyltransferase [Coraliomargaritaceae bacterium]
MHPKTPIQSILLEKANQEPISYRDYIEIALYTEGYGYYRKNRPRVGRSPERDFYTAESLGRVFSQLIVDACTELLGPDRAAGSEFIEIGAEPGYAVLDQLPSSSPFRRSKVIRFGDAIEAQGEVVLFANEWLDARPFHRLQFHQGIWRERGVQISNQGELRETLLDTLSPAVQMEIHRLPPTAPEGYELDWPLDAEQALQHLLAQEWSGLLLFLDYGKTWKALLEDCPSGTARCYRKHQQSNNLLEATGEKDITCDVCWDPLIEQLQAAQCGNVTLESQESFFVRRAAKAAQNIVQKAATGFDSDRQTLMELIHPAHMGQRFQALWAIRNPQ